MAAISSSATCLVASGAQLTTRSCVKNVPNAIPQASGLSSLSGSLTSKRQQPSFRQVVVGQVGNCRSRVTCLAGDVSADGTNFLIIGAVAIALVGTALPILFSRKDTCPDCDGAGFVRKTGERLNANAARKDEGQIVCSRCNGLGKLGQTDKV